MEVISIEESLNNRSIVEDNETPAVAKSNEAPACPTQGENGDEICPDISTIDELLEAGNPESVESQRPKRRNKRNIIKAPRNVNRYRRDSNGRWRRVLL